MKRPYDSNPFIDGPGSISNNPVSSTICNISQGIAMVRSMILNDEGLPMTLQHSEACGLKIILDGLENATLHVLDKFDNYELRRSIQEANNE